MPMSDKQKQSLLNVLDYLADEEENYKSEPSDNHIWLDCQVLWNGLNDYGVK